MSEKIDELLKIFLLSNKFPSDLRLFIIAEKKYIRVYYGKVSVSGYSEDFGIVKTLKFERGHILDMFSKLEFFINEIFQLKILGVNSDRAIIFDKILENIDLFTRIKILNESGIIGDNLLNRLMQAKQVRNGFAHAWDENEIAYKGKPAKNNFSEFKTDMEEVWRGLIEIYKTEQEKIDISSIIYQIKELNSSKES